MMGLKRGVLIIVASVLLGYLSSSWAVLHLLLTPEHKPMTQTPVQLGFPNTKSVWVETSKDHIRLRGWLVPANQSRAIILVHGIHSNAWDCQTPDVVRAYQASGFQVFLFDLRAHGGSGGEHIGLGLHEHHDIQAIVDYLQTEAAIPPGSIGLHGTSYGAVVALFAAADIEAIKAVIADSAYANLFDVIGGELERQTGLPSEWGVMFAPGFELMGRVVYGLDIDKAMPLQAVRKIQQRPLLLIHGQEDEILPPDHARRLNQAGGPNTQLWLLPGRRHTQGVRLVPDCDKLSPLREEFLRRTTSFFKRYL
ncbi:peptidase S15 [Nitrosococcus halophilus Nc 4]|uniref:Peptidase S15 n=1 Tax=Nitrosococcus halophilus (strain Nc4) TaxID=472759 RepID=D5C4X6_NITHN|nr:alpha/beta fold hydrolase [Nitrosococcus halophilus]ADE13399.1 peptidase S15 [Nitrosococcus halophilus Nc 4]